MKPYKRTERIADLIMRTLATLLQTKSEDPRFVHVTVTHVKVAPDFSRATVFVTIIEEQNIAETLNALQKAAGFFQRLLAKQLQLRSVPKLTFVYDEMIAKASYLSDLIDQTAQATAENMSDES